MKKTGVTVLGAIWGVFSMMFGVVVLIILFLERDAVYSLGRFSDIGVCLYNSVNAFGFTPIAYVIGLGGFALVLLGLVSVNVSRRSNIAGGVLMLISVVGVFLLYYLPLTFSGDSGVIPRLGMAFELGFTETAVITLASLLATVLGLIAAILTFMPGKPRYSQYGAYAQPYQAQQPYGQPQPYGQQYGQPYGQPQYRPQYQPFGQQPYQPYQQQTGQPYGQPYQQPQYQPPQQPPSASGQKQPETPEQPQASTPQQPQE